MREYDQCVSLTRSEQLCRVPHPTRVTGTQRPSRLATNYWRLEVGEPADQRDYVVLWRQLVSFGRAARVV
jgi:hypothetical protein